MSRAKRISARSVVDYVANRHNFTYAQLISVRRSREIARPRQIAMYAISELCPHMSLPATGKLLGRDHTTVLHGIRTIRSMIPTHERVASEVRATIEYFQNQREEPTDLMLSAQIDATSKHLEVLIREARHRVDMAVAA